MKRYIKAANQLQWENYNTCKKAVQDFFKNHLQLDINKEAVKNEIDSVANLLWTAPEGYTIEDWYEDTMENYPNWMEEDGLLDDDNNDKVKEITVYGPWNWGSDKIISVKGKIPIIVCTVSHDRDAFEILYSGSHLYDHEEYYSNYEDFDKALKSWVGSDQRTYNDLTEFDYLAMNKKFDGRLASICDCGRYRTVCHFEKILQLPGDLEHQDMGERYIDKDYPFIGGRTLYESRLIYKESENLM